METYKCSEAASLHLAPLQLEYSNDISPEENVANFLGMPGLYSNNLTTIHFIASACIYYRNFMVTVDLFIIALQSSILCII